jgi:hypothetical protein
MTEEDTAASAQDGLDAIPDTGGVAATGGVAHTGDARVDEAVARLGELADAPLDEHPVILGQIHDRLREVLGELGSPGAP